MRKTIITIILLLFTTSAQAMTAKVVSVIDGDTIKIMGADGLYSTARLYGVDSPEKKQSFGLAAKDLPKSSSAGKPSISPPSTQIDMGEAWQSLCSVRNAFRSN